MTQLIAGNWKMNGCSADTVERVAQIVRGSSGISAELLICPPFTQLAAVAGMVRASRVCVGGQDCHAAAAGAHTGDVSAAMLADLGCRAVIVGHSERRADHGETDLIVRGKAAAAIAAGLMPIVCVGETEAERDAGHAEALVCRQVEHSLPDVFAGTVAYEPIWAIGTGRTPTEDDVRAMHTAVRAALVRRLGIAGQDVRILYGGSVKPENAARLLAVPEVGGALVGGASLDAGAFLTIAAASPPG